MRKRQRQPNLISRSRSFGVVPARGQKCPGGIRSEGEPTSGPERIHVPIDENAGGGEEAGMKGADVESVLRCRAMMGLIVVWGPSWFLDNSAKTFFVWHKFEGLF